MRHVVLLAALLLTLASSVAHADRLVVIVHPERDAKTDLADIVQIYLKQRRFWKDGETIIPVNREAGSATREDFARFVFHDDSRGLTTYWNREYFRGIFPPPTLASDEAVLRFVATEPRAIGYVPATLVDERVKVVLRLGPIPKRQRARTRPQSVPAEIR